MVLVDRARFSLREWLECDPGRQLGRLCGEAITNQRQRDSLVVTDSPLEDRFGRFDRIDHGVLVQRALRVLPTMFV